VPSAVSADLSHIDTWLFDLDNTLYPVECELMARVADRMTVFVARRTGLPATRPSLFRSATCTSTEPPWPG